jgi:hypothetical protein
MSPGVWQKAKPVQCDFCSSPEVVRWYKCRDFSSDSKAIGIEYRGQSAELFSVGEWASCGQCAALIDVMDLEGLVNRACIQFNLKHPGYEIGDEIDEVIRKHVAYTYELFFTNKI